MRNIIHNPYLLLDIFIASLHHRMTGVPMPRICHMLSLPLTSPLSVYISDKPIVKALLPLLTLEGSTLDT